MKFTCHRWHVRRVLSHCVQARGGDLTTLALSSQYLNAVNTSLVDTFRELYGDVFMFEGNRAIVFGEADEIPVAELKHCISLALTYHRVKRLPLLGAGPRTHDESP